ncbi:MAG: carboxylate--amine ligase [Planctomycetota bacterium]|jgi:predicted ATP-grasp superfamily ATP-dependent carboligase
MNNHINQPEVFIFEAEAKSALPVAESFTQHGFRVIAGSYRKYCAAFYSRAVRERVHIPDGLNNPDKCSDFLLNFTKRRRFEMIVPLGDVFADMVSSRLDEFMKYTKLMLVPHNIFILGRDKVETMKAAQKCGIPLPNTYYPEEQSLDEIAKLTDYPVLVKPAIANGARGIRFCHNKTELIDNYQEISKAFGRTFVQEFIPHQGMQYKIDLILDRDGTLLAGVVYNKIRYYPPTAGSSVLNKTVNRPDILEYATRIARSIGWYGLCDFDFIHDVRDNKTKIMEINPRFPESFRMCHVAGIDFPWILYKMACGQKVEPTTQYKLNRTRSERAKILLAF